MLVGYFICDKTEGTVPAVLLCDNSENKTTGTVPSVLSYSTASQMLRSSHFKPYSLKNSYNINIPEVSGTVGTFEFPLNLAENQKAGRDDVDVTRDPCRRIGKADCPEHQVGHQKYDNRDSGKHFHNT